LTEAQGWLFGRVYLHHHHHHHHHKKGQKRDKLKNMIQAQRKIIAKYLESIQMKNI
jgi:hypothetical protein